MKTKKTKSPARRSAASKSATKKSAAIKKVNEDEKNAYLDGVVEARGFRFGLHEIHAESDWEYTKKYEEWMRFIYVNGRFLDAKTKELILTGMLTCMRAPTLHIKAHMNAAVKVGATSDEIIEVVELCGQWGGSLAMADGLSAWRLQFAPHLPDIFDKVKTKKYHK